MKFKRQKSLMARLERELKREIEGRRPCPPFAVFDADGTLWPEDVNHILLEYEQSRGLREMSDLLRAEDWAGRRGERCAAFARRQAGFSCGELKAHCRKALAAKPIRPFPFLTELLRRLRERGIAVYVISASLEILVAEALAALGLSAGKILGVKCRAEGGKITGDVLAPLTYGSGKKEALLQAANGAAPLLAAGNTFSDLPLLEAAAIPLAVHSAPPGHENFPAEKKLRDLAKKNKWILLEAETAKKPLFF